jgi:bacteriocin biosynthesis cyclodehydratase domain-containing protein
MLADRNLRFPHWPRLIDDIQVFQMPDGLGVQFRGAEAPVVVRGAQADAALTFLSSVLDGTRTLDDLLNECPPQLSPVTLLRTLALLHSKSLLTGTASEESERPAIKPLSPGGDVLQRQLVFWGRKLGLARNAVSGEEVQGRLASFRFVLLATGLFGIAVYDLLVRSGCLEIQVIDWDDEGNLADTLADQAVPPRRLVHLPSTSTDDAARSLAPMLTDVDLLVMATRNAPAELFRTVNRLCLDHNCSWLRANDNGTDVEIGPYVRPFRTGCFTCMRLRRVSADDFAVEEHLYQQHLAEAHPAGATRPLGEALPVATLAASLIVMEVVRIVTGLAPVSLVDTVMTVDPTTGSFRTNRFLRVPRCPDCYRGTLTSLAEAPSRA